MNHLLVIVKKLFKQIDSTEYARLELADAKKLYLQYKSHEEQARYMSNCYAERISRLSDYLEKETYV